MPTELKENEEIFDLECAGLRIIQKKDGYAFTTDAVLLANTVKAVKGDRIIELGSGSGVISMLLAAKTNASEIYGVEIQERLAEMSERSVEMNALTDKVKIVRADIRDARNVVGGKHFDVCYVNPPYGIYRGKKEDASEIDICKSEVLITLDEIVKSAAELLKYGGKFYAIVKSERAVDLICSMRAHGIEPKVITPVQPTPYKDVDTVIAEGRRNGHRGVKIYKPLVICNADGSYTDRVKEMYGK